MKISDITSSLEQWAPLSLQESYDNAGLIVGNASDEATGVLVSLDCTEAVVMEAVQKGINLVVSHHPIVFEGLKKFSSPGPVEKALLAAIRHNIALYAIHTNLDAVPDGVNGKIASLLGLRDCTVLKPALPGSKIGAGLVGNLAEKTGEAMFLKKIKETMKAPCLRHTALLGKPMQRVAVCGGSGGFLLEEAINSGAGLFLTSDVKYHRFFDADGRIVLADIGHFESEQFTQDLLASYLKEKFPNFAVLFTEINTNPINYLL